MNTSKMYFNKFSSGTILALLALSGMLFLVPLAAPVHATNSSPLVYTVTSGNPVKGATSDIDIDFSITNPASNQYAIQVVNFAAPTGWTIVSCGAYSAYLAACTSSTNSAQFTSYQNGQYPNQLPPGATATFVIEVDSPAGVYPFSSSFTSTIQDASSASFYAGPSISLQVIDPNSNIVNTNVVVTPGGSNTATAYSAGTAPYTVTAQLTCPVTVDCPNGYENGVDLVWSANYTAGTSYSFSPTSGYTSGTGEVTTTFQPSNSIFSGEVQITVTAGTSSIANSPSTGAITTLAGVPTSVGFFLTSPSTAFPATDYLTTEGTTTNSNTAGTFTGAELSHTVTPVYVSASDKFGNPDKFGTSGPGVVIGGTINIQTASGAVFDVNTLPSTISITTPTSGSSVEITDNYFQSGTYATAGVLTATISGATYDGNPLSVSGSSGTIQTSTFATSGSFETTNHVALGATSIVAGKSLTFEYVLGTAQSGVPVTVAICQNTSCSATTKGYSGTITTATGVTNSTGVFSTKLTVDTTANTVAELNATVSAPINTNAKNTFVTGPSAAITTTAGTAAKFTVVVGPTTNLEPSPITNSVPGATVYVNVVTSDAYGNPVSTVGSEQVQVNLVANPSTITVTSAYIPTNCYETNGTSLNGCSSGYSSFGPIAWTLPTTVGSTATITASGVLGGVTVTSATTTITIVSKLPTWSLFSPAATSGVVYSSSVNLQFRGWANVSAGYNSICPGNACSDTMSTLGWQIGSGTWQSTGLSGTNDQWSVVATLPTGLDSITFNATDTKGNTVVSSPYSVLVDTQAPVVTDVTTAGANLTAGQLFQASIVSDQGDLNASSVTVQYNGTTLASSAVTVSGTNDNGHSVTYTLTASLPTGHWNVQVSATSLAGLTGTSTSELVTVFVAPGNSVTFNTSGATYGAVGAYSGVTISVTNSWSTSQTIVVFATLKSGTSIYVAQGTVTLAAGQTQSVFLADLLPVPAGSYTVTFAAVTTDNLPVSAPTTPITVTVA